MKTSSQIRTKRSTRHFLGIAAIMAFVFSMDAVAKSCELNAAFHTLTLDFGKDLTEALGVPQDAAANTIIYQESISVGRQYVSCYGQVEPWGFDLSPSLGSVISGSVFPLGKSGFSFRIRRPSSNYLSTLKSAFLNNIQGEEAGNYRLEITRSGEQPLQQTIPSGYLGQYKIGSAVMSKFYLKNTITLTPASCQTPAVLVQMGDDYELKDFDNTADTPRLIKFNIGLKECQSGINKVTYSLKATTSSQAIDRQKGIVALNNGPQAAKGIGLQLMNDAGQPIALDTTYPFNGFDTAGKSFNIPLTAAYYRLADGTLEAGVANASVTFIVNYL